MSSDQEQLRELLDRAPEPTKRPTVAAMEERLFQLVPVLDHGFIRVVDYMGDDGAVVQAARVSYGAGTKSVRNDRGLLRYLMRHRHSTPFEMCEVKLHVKLPIFVARQWIRHRTANVNEYSARYSILDREFYLPAPEDLAQQSSSNRQGRDEILDPAQAAEVLRLLHRDASQAYDTYENLINDTGDGTPVDEGSPQLARELARMNLSLNYYTQWYWKVDVHNLLHFLSLRMDSHAQYEIRVYADIMGDILKSWMPLTWEAFSDYRQGSAHLAREEVGLLQRMVAGEDPDQLLPASGLSLRERKAMRQLLKLGPPKRQDPWSCVTDRLAEVEDLGGVRALMAWDQETNMPRKGVGARGAQSARLAKLAHERLTDPAVGGWLESLGALEDPTPEQRACVRNLGRDYRRATRVSSELVGDLVQGATEGFESWIRARKEKSFATFEPSLQNLVDLTKRRCEAIDPNTHPYDVLLEEYVPGTTSAQLREMFGRLTGGIRTLLDRLDQVEAMPVYDEAFDTQIQRKVYEQVTRQMGFDMDAGRIDLAEHPFTTSLGPGDTRFTIRVFEKDVLAGLGPTMHEAGHGLYEQGLPWEKKGTTVASAAGLGLHESQSRLWENFIGRSQPFMRWFATQMDASFEGRKVDGEHLYRAANRVVPGLTRVEADEVTYNLHVAIRFELEYALMEGSLAVKDLPEAWNQRYQGVLGVTPPDDTQGVLQDVHWSHGMFGYFPSYTMGNLYAASLGVALESEFGEALWENVEAGRFEDILGWLRAHIHVHGHMEDSPVLIHNAVGERDHVEDLLNHLWGRHGALHGLSR